MSKIYVVQASSGSYDDYVKWNEKAFVNIKDAEKFAKELDKERINKPSFITYDFEKLFVECEDELQDWDEYNHEDDYDEYVRIHQEEDRKTLVKMMNERGQNMTEEMYDQYYEWLSHSYEEQHPCTIEELELCE